MIYRKIMSKYKERVASAETISDFVAIWLVIMSLHAVCGIILILIEKFLFLEDKSGFWISFGWDYLFTAFVLLLAAVFSFHDANVQFWNPRVHWQKEYLGKIDIEKTRKMHTNFPCMEIVAMNFFVLCFGIICIPVFIILAILALFGHV